MKPNEIKALLIEAQTASVYRQNAILRELEHASCERDNPATVLMSHLYVTTLIHNPKHLIALLPVFIAVCGDRQVISLFADDLYPKL